MEDAGFKNPSEAMESCVNLKSPLASGGIRKAVCFRHASDQWKIAMFHWHAYLF